MCAMAEYMCQFLPVVVVELLLGGDRVTIEQHISCLTRSNGHHVRVFVENSMLFLDPTSLKSNIAFHFVTKDNVVPRLKAQSHQASSNYVLFRTGWPPESFEQVQSSGCPSPFR